MTTAGDDRRRDLAEAHGDAVDARADASSARSDASEARSDAVEARADAVEARADAATGRTDAVSLHEDYVRISAELQAARVAMGDLEGVVGRWARVTRRSRGWTLVLAIVTVVLTLVLAGLIGLTLWVYRDAQRTDDAIVQLGRDLFLESCVAHNKGKAALRANDLAETEDLIDIFRADAEAPEQAAEARRRAEVRAAANVDRDCDAELAEIESR